MTAFAEVAPEVQATFNAAANHPLKLAVLGSMALEPGKPFIGSMFIAKFNSGQGSYPGYIMPKAKAGALSEYCDVAFANAELVTRLGHRKFEVGRPAQEYAVSPESAPGILATVGACLDWELECYDTMLSTLVGARSSGRGKLDRAGATTRLEAFDQALSVGHVTIRALAERTGRPEKKEQDLLRQLGDTGLLTELTGAYDFGQRHISLLGYPADFIPLRRTEYFELKALYALFTEMCVRKQYQTTGRFVLNALRAQFPDMDMGTVASLLRRRAESSWKRFVVLETSTQTKQLHQKRYGPAADQSQAMQELVNRYKSVRSPDTWQKWGDRAREILTTPDIFAELMEKAAAADSHRSEAKRLDDNLAKEITAVIGSSGGLTFGELYARLSERRAVMPSRWGLRVFIRRHDRLVYNKHASAGTSGVHHEGYVTLPGANPAPKKHQQPLAVDITKPSDWRDNARCRNTDTEKFFDNFDRDDLKKFCAECPVQSPCFQFAAATVQRYGVWGGVGSKYLEKYVSKLPKWLLKELYPNLLTNMAMLKGLNAKSVE
jgi:WhiB family redox-sensing transcriptional regulator